MYVIHEVEFFLLMCISFLGEFHFIPYSSNESASPNSV